MCDAESRGAPRPAQCRVVRCRRFAPFRRHIESKAGGADATRAVVERRRGIASSNTLTDVAQSEKDEGGR